MRLSSLLVVFPVVACGLESGGLGPNDAGKDSPGLEDRGVGMTDSGQTCTCIKDPGMGWKFVAYTRDAAPPCGGDYAMQKYAVDAKGGAPTCTCTCTPAADAACAVTAFQLTAYTNSNCSMSDKMISANVACFDINPDYNPNGSIWAKGTATVSVTGGTCNAPVTNMNLPLELHTGQACMQTGAFGSGCANGGDVCVPANPMGSALCVATAQANATCPAGFNTKYAVGTAKNDNRSCAPACTCSPSPNCAPEAQFYNDNGTCSSTKKEAMAFALDGTCQPVTNAGFSGHSVLGDIAKITQGCTAQGWQPSGAVSLVEEYTICCP